MSKTEHNMHNSKSSIISIEMQKVTTDQEGENNEKVARFDSDW
jgi:hypothetical protein